MEQQRTKQPAALVTGASDRLGKAIAQWFAQNKYAIALHYNHSSQKAEATAEMLRSEYQVECRIFKADFNDQQQVKQLIPTVQNHFALKVLVNSASLFYENSFPDAPDEDFDHFFAPNFRAPYLLTKAFGRLKPQNGLVINILDTDVARQKTAHFDYLLTKKFLWVFTPMAAYHLAPNIRVNAIAPGYLLPPKERGQIAHDKAQEYLDALSEQAPLQKQGQAGDITDAMDYLVKNIFVTGQVIFADGGMHLH